jgi:hypothetical protein
MTGFRFNFSASGSGRGGRASEIGGGIGIILFALFWLGISGTMFVLLAWQVLGQAWTAATYQPVEAVVVQYTPVDKSGDEDRPATIAYTYTVAGQSHEGSYSVPLGPWARDEYSAALAGPMDTGRPLTAWHDPGQPEKSTLNPAMEISLLGMLIFVTPFVLVGVALGSGGVAPILSAWRAKQGGQAPASAGTGVAFVIAYFVFSAIAAFGLIFLATLMDWRLGVGLGLALWVAGVPLAARAVARWIGRSSQEKEAAEGPASPAAATGAGAPGARPAVAQRAREADARRVLPLFALFWCAITGVAVGFVGVTVWRHLDAQRRFESTMGVVVSSRVKSHSGSKSTTYSADIRYRYTVAGQEYTSSGYSFSEMSSSGGGYSRSLVDRHPPGKRVTVYYDPENPASAVLATEVPPMMWFLSLFLQPFILVGVGLVGALVVWAVRRRRIRAFLAEPLRPPCTIPAWGRLEMGRDGYTVRPAPAVLGPLMAFAGGYGVACFLSIFVVAFASGGFEGDPRAVRVAFVVAAGVGVAGAAWSVIKGGGEGVLRIDESAGQVTVARRREPVSESLKDIDHWTVSWVAGKTQAGKGPPTRQTQLAGVTAGGRVVPLHTFPSGDECDDLARAVGEWLAGVTRKPFMPAKA